MAHLSNSTLPSTPLGDSESNASALYQSFFMILASEVGDKTFLIAAILSMRHPRLVVFLGAFSSLAVMSVLSAGMGRLLPSLFLPRKWTQLGAAILFLWFGVKMAREGWEMEGGNAKVQEEMKEVEEEIGGEQEGLPMQDLEGGKLQTLHTVDSTGHCIGVVEDESDLTPSKSDFATRQRSKDVGSKLKEGAHNFASLFLGPVFVQSFVLTFLGEWGDRSQIATIALAAAHVRRLDIPAVSFANVTLPLQNVYIVTLGTVVGHSICTAVAVLGGRWISTQISIKHGMSHPFFLEAGLSLTLT
jgi:putative Ca2+/H+ antiporter (TMEM165/GDT1 family)